MQTVAGLLGWCHFKSDCTHRSCVLCLRSLKT